MSFLLFCRKLQKLKQPHLMLAPLMMISGWGDNNFENGKQIKKNFDDHLLILQKLLIMPN